MLGFVCFLRSVHSAQRVCCYFPFSLVTSFVSFAVLILSRSLALSRFASFATDCFPRHLLAPPQSAAGCVLLAVGRVRAMAEASAAGSSSASVTAEDARAYGHYVSMRNKYFKNGSHLLDELSFVCHYHYTGANQALHLVGWTAIEFLALTALALCCPTPRIAGTGIPTYAMPRHSRATTRTHPLATASPVRRSAYCCARVLCRTLRCCLSAPSAEHALRLAVGPGLRRDDAVG